MLRTTVALLLAVQLFATGQPVWASCDGALRSLFHTLFSTPTADKPFAEELAENSLEALAQLGHQPKAGHGPLERWIKDGTGSSGYYARDFCQVVRLTGGQCSQLFFAAWLTERKAAGLSTHVLDLMGSGLFLTQPALADTITGLRWGPYRPRPEEEKVQIPTQILGDILNPQTWEVLDKSMRERGIPSMDLITLRPQGGWELAPWYDSAEGNIQTLRLILGQALKRLSPTGRVYFHIPLNGLRGLFRQHPLVQSLISEIDARTPYRLVLVSSESSLGRSYQVSGALVPK